MVLVMNRLDGSCNIKLDRPQTNKSDDSCNEQT